jgi:hypothetical protein
VPGISTTFAKRTANKRITTGATAKRIRWFQKVERHPRAGGPIDMARLLSKTGRGEHEKGEPTTAKPAYGGLALT